ncbi:hypothetical protein WN48_02256 [Eufriesea mexicana]|uniref:MYND-type domain-containing protein n=1 Tax=Eufriesea mexicana TaxID=516756 RepID=A0A310SC23_9HYME|nr:hypothetical protein WN48_02256 [Eufriesea mexicana]
MKLLVSTRGPCWAVAGQDRHFASQPHGVELNHPCGLTVDGTSPSASMCPSPSRVRLRQRTAPSRSEDALIRGGLPGTRCMTRLTVTGNECRRRVPPENELQKVGERVPSEHELRVQRSLQRLNVPDWYKNSPAARDGFRLKRHSDASQHGGWRALGSKTTSLSSLSSSSNRQPTTGVRWPMDETYEFLLLTAMDRTGAAMVILIMRKLELFGFAFGNTCPSKSKSHATCILKMEYQSAEQHRKFASEFSEVVLQSSTAILGLAFSGTAHEPADPGGTSCSGYSSPVASSQQEVRNSIKEVTSAIVHYVQSGQEVGGGGRLSPRPRPEDWDDRGGARSTSPRVKERTIRVTGSRNVLNHVVVTAYLQGSQQFATPFHDITTFCYVFLRSTRDGIKRRHKEATPRKNIRRHAGRWLLHDASNEMKLLLEGSVKLCWMESSFVGTRPVDSPETPMSLATEIDCCPGCNATATESCSCVKESLYFMTVESKSALHLHFEEPGPQSNSLAHCCLPVTVTECQEQRLRMTLPNSLELLHPSSKMPFAKQENYQAQRKTLLCPEDCQRTPNLSPFFGVAVNDLLGRGSSDVAPRPVYIRPSPLRPLSTRLARTAVQSQAILLASVTSVAMPLTPRDGVVFLHASRSGQSDTDEAMATAALLRNKPSPGSTTLEDVLDSLLGLPSASRTPSPGPGPVVTGTSATMRHRTNVGQANAKAGKSCSDLRQDLQESARSVMDVQGASEEHASYYVGELVRRKSEGSDTMPSKTVATQSRGGPLSHRRVSFDNQEANGVVAGNVAEKVIRCRNNKCNNSATLAEAKKTYKSCHNCTCLYCSRECRRAHWQRHRRTCLHSRAGSLCKQVLSSAKEDPITLKHISALAKRGYAFHGRGAVKCFFSSLEAAEKFISNGFVDLGEPTYVRWSDLLAREMGAELYAEVIRLCKSYNPDTRLVLYVAVFVVSEVPTSGAVKWERQLVSRCAKIHLDSANRHHTSSSSASPQGRQQSTSPCNITREMESPEMLVLTSLPGNNGQNTPKKIREISFANIQRQLKLRGVSLRRHFPQVYRKLRAYVDGTVDKFPPVTMYPRDQASGKSFMCIIMLGVEAERLQLLPTDSSRVRTVDISVEEE